MKSFQETTSDKTKPDKVLVYMVPSVDEVDSRIKYSVQVYIHSETWDGMEILCT